jgi:hypothetical protein
MYIYNIYIYENLRVTQETAWCADYWRGGVPSPEVVVEGVKEVK